MRRTILCAAAAVPPLMAAAHDRADSRRLQADLDYSSISCTTHQPAGAEYCNTIAGMEQASCTCGSCDQNKQSIPDEGLPVGFAGGGSQACGGLCSVGFPSFPIPEQVAQRNNLCVFPNGEGQDGVCKKYSCQHFTKQNCASLNPMLAFMDPTASPADYFSCEQLICVSCPHAAGCLVHGPSGCMYDAALEGVCSAVDSSDGAAVAACNAVTAQQGARVCSGTRRCTKGGSIDETITDHGQCEDDGGTWASDPVCQSGVEEKFDEWRYVPPVPGQDPEADRECGYVDEAGTPYPPEERRGRRNVDYIPGTSDAIEKCTCTSCYMTMTDYTNRDGGGYKDYCNLNVCTEDGTTAEWSMSQGFQIPSDTASSTDQPESYKTFAELADTLGASPEVLLAFTIVSSLLILYCLFSLACGSNGDSKEYDSDDSCHTDSEEEAD